ncbi:hypothetical protein [Umezawaea sp.]|uniref:hypothetical protein n=1 Tax=Umezawaea sp. TaxID=1955258 RepID=UPI002ED4BF07
MTDLMDRRPRTVVDGEPHPLPGRLTDLARSQPWVDDAWIRLREEGHVFVGEMLVVPGPGTDDLPKRLEELGELLRDTDWRMHDLVVAPVHRIDHA